MFYLSRSNQRVLNIYNFHKFICYNMIEGEQLHIQ